MKILRQYSVSPLKLLDKGGVTVDFRHEWKININRTDKLILQQRLDAVMRRDAHCINGTYCIRSLYFDNTEDKALREKLDGVNIREKFRIRYYNNDYLFIVLEKKSKINGLCLKDSVNITKAEAQKIADGDIGWMAADNRELVCELYSKMLSQGLRGMTVVDYCRIPFVFDPGNVRVTLDYDIRTALRTTDFLNPDIATISVPDDPLILEVKWDEFLPDIIRDAVNLPGRRSEAFSKYAACRSYDI